VLPNSLVAPWMVDRDGLCGASAASAIVRAENLVRGCDQQGCPPCRPVVMVTVMCLRFAFLLITQMTSWLRLSRREEAWRTAEILLLRHQLTVLQRQQPRRPNLTWVDGALIALLFAVIPNARRNGLRLLVTPDTIVRWHRDIVRRRWAARSKRGRTGRPATRRNIKALMLRLARENPGWGYRRIHGELADLGVKIAPPTAWEILNKAGIGPAPRRTGPAWSLFLRSQAEAILARLSSRPTC